MAVKRAAAGRADGDLHKWWRRGAWSMVVGSRRSIAKKWSLRIQRLREMMSGGELTLQGDGGGLG